MRAFAATFRAGFLYLWRQPVSVLVMTLFPILLIFVLGNALGALMANDYDIEPIPVAYLSGEAGTPLYTFLTDEEGASRFIALRRVPAEEADALLRAGEVDAVISEGEETRILYGGSARNAALVRGIVEGYRQTGAAAAKAFERQPQTAARLLLAEVSVRTDAVGSHIPAAIDYYAVTMMVMISLFSGLSGVDLFHKNLMSELSIRVHAAPVPRRTVILGTMAASLTVSFTQLLITFAVSAGVYGVYWGGRVPLILLTFLLMVVFSQMLCLTLFLAVGSHEAVTGITQGLFWLLTFFSKGYVQMDFGAAEKVFQYIPNALAQTVIFGAAYGGDEGKMMFALGFLLALSTALCGLSFVLGRRRLA
ncbi:MAG: ABC transporter permease [Oscillospiraceae bacterium]|jgi:ABC-2 type transport system permease protein|nr:ABC transporter permease [Oscillospiraceae bacterium]